jgi:D-glycero-D-manno-heptose 1,7-bisphosphate phosphatase
VTPSRPAAFLDRDGTIIHDVDYISRPEDVRLLPGVAEAIRSLNEAGVPVVVVSNQSGLGRGYFTYEDYEGVRARIEELLRAGGAHVDATYICPHPPADPPACACRKPGIGLFEQAAREHGLDLSGSWYAGDKWRDVQPGLTLHGQGLLIRATSTPPEDLERAQKIGIVRDSLADVAREIIATLTGGQSTR